MIAANRLGTLALNHNSYANPWRPPNGWDRSSSAPHGAAQRIDGAPAKSTPRIEMSPAIEPVVEQQVAAEEEEDEDVGLQRSRVEALLLVAKIPLPPRRLAALAELPDATRARTLVNELNQLYDSLGRGLRIESVAGGYRLLTRPVVAPWLGRLGFLPSAIRLSWPMMETLAVVAYRQDVTRADVEAVRGVACGEILRQLMQLDLVRISGRSEELGRPYLYGTTKRFLKIFGLPSINALPPIDWRNIREHLADSETPNPLSPRHDSSPSPDSCALKESDVSVVLSQTLSLETFVPSMLDLADGQDAAIATMMANAGALTVDSDVRNAIDDEEDDLYESDDDDEDVDDDWDDEEESDDVDDEEEDEDEEDVDADEEEEDADEEEEDADWEEVDDDDADEDWEEDEEDDDDDWEEDDDESSEDEDDDDWDS